MGLFNDQDIADIFNLMQKDDPAFNSRSQFDAMFTPDLKQYLPQETIDGLATIAATTWGLPDIAQMASAKAQIGLSSCVNTESKEKAPSLKLNDMTYQGLLDLVDFYKTRPQLAKTQRDEILDYCSEFFEKSQFTGFVEPMVAFMLEQGWIAATPWLSDRFIYIPNQIASPEDFAVVLKQSLIISCLLDRGNSDASQWQETIKHRLLEFFKLLPVEQVGMLANQLPSWVLSQMYADYRDSSSKVVHGRLELVMREVDVLLSSRHVQDERKAVLSTLDKWALAVQKGDATMIRAAEKSIKMVTNMPNQPVLGLFRPLKEWAVAQTDVQQHYHDRIEQLELYYQAVPIMKQQLQKLKAFPSERIKGYDKETLSSWWPVLEPFLSSMLDTDVVEELRTPLCKNLDKLQVLMGLSRDAIIKTLQQQLRG